MKSRVSENVLPKFHGFIRHGCESESPLVFLAVYTELPKPLHPESHYSKLIRQTRNQLENTFKN